MEAGTDHHLEVIKWHVDGFAIILSLGKKLLAHCQLVALKLPLNVQKKTNIFSHNVVPPEGTIDLSG